MTLKAVTLKEVYKCPECEMDMWMLLHEPQPIAVCARCGAKMAHTGKNWYYTGVSSSDELGDDPLLREFPTLCKGPRRDKWGRRV